jgi:SAM-dependent methyltransferase
MSKSIPANRPTFDDFAVNYDEALAQGISVSGETKDYFAQGRVSWLARRLTELDEHPQHILDYGCGTGTGTRFLVEQYPSATVLGLDISPYSLEIGRRLHASSRVQFDLTHEYQPAGEMDIAFCNGVFHHIPLDERAKAVQLVWSSLRPGGLFSFWENNPWNPGTRYVMSRIPFDRDAIPLSPPVARRLLGGGGFEVLRTDYLFVFPRSLKILRKLEPSLVSLPFGAQYLVLCRKR